MQIMRVLLDLFAALSGRQADSLCSSVCHDNCSLLSNSLATHALAMIYLRPTRLSAYETVNYSRTDIWRASQSQLKTFSFTDNEREGGKEREREKT